MPTDDSLASRNPALALTPVQTPVQNDGVPAYLRDIYSWAYLSPIGRAIFDHPPVVSAILWGNYHRLIRWVEDEIRPGDRMLQIASVYGEFSPRMARAVGPEGSLDVIDIAPIQVEHTRIKLKPYPQARVALADAAVPPDGPFDVAVSFFLLHEVPEDYKSRIVNAALERVQPGGKMIFIDYHRPANLHPLRPIMVGVFALLEPFAKILWTREISSYARDAAKFTWTKETCFGGLYQKVIAIHRAD
jgi:ubiquinone/menaquinone biosynthesis C-methylase UbiE